MNQTLFFIFSVPERKALEHNKVKLNTVCILTTEMSFGFRGIFGKLATFKVVLRIFAH